MKIAVYRIQLGFSFLNENCTPSRRINQGPYTSYTADMSILNNYVPWYFKYNELLNPEPTCELVDPYYMFGFKDIMQMNAWFYPDITNLINAGFVLAEYEVYKTQVKYNKHQIAFSKGAVLKNIHNIKEAICNEIKTNKNYYTEIKKYFTDEFEYYAI